MTIAREFQPSLKGALKPSAYHRYFTVRSFVPLGALAPYIAYYWVERRRPEYSMATYTPEEILVRPASTLTITSGTAVLHGVATGLFQYGRPLGDMTVGVRFAPGGLHALLGKGGVDIAADTVLSADDVFSHISSSWIRELLVEKDDQEILFRLHTLFSRYFTEHHPNAVGKLKTIERTLAIIEQGDPSRQTVVAIAEACQYSERRLQAIFQEYVGVGIKWMIMRARHLRALEYAHEQHAPIEWVRAAHEIGYNSQAHFVTDFRAIVGSPPGRYKNNS